MIRHPLYLFTLCGALSLIAACSPAHKPSAQLEVASRSVQSGALSRGGEWAVIGSAYQGGSLWHLPDNRREYSWNHKAKTKTLIQTTAISPKARWAITADLRTLVLWSIHTGHSKAYWRIPSDILASALGRSGNIALLGLSDGSAVLYDLNRGGNFQRFAHPDRVNAVALSDNLALSATGCDDHSARIWNNKSGKLITRYSFSEPVQVVALTPDGKRAFAAAKYDRADIFTAATGERIWQLPLKHERVLRGLNISVARFSPDGDYLLTGRADGVVELWDIAHKQRVYRWQLPKRKAWQPTGSPVIDVSFSKDNNRYMAISGNGMVYTLTY